MAPTRFASKPIGANENLNGILSHGITTRSKQLASLKTHKDGLKVPNKRKADSPLKDITAKRAAFGDITNAFNKASAVSDKEKIIVVKKVTVETKMLPTVKVNKYLIRIIFILEGTPDCFSVNLAAVTTIFFENIPFQFHIDSSFGSMNFLENFCGCTIYY